MKKFKEFRQTVRYEFDFGSCSSENGFAQVDTTQDASYFGTWANPFNLIVFQYCEGDIYKTVCDNLEEFKTEMIEIKDWNTEREYWLGIDPGLREKNINKWKEIGLSDLLHKEYR